MSIWQIFEILNQKYSKSIFEYILLNRPIKSLIPSLFKSVDLGEERVETESIKVDQEL